MSLIFNGNSIPINGNVIFNGVSLTKVIFNSSTVWTKYTGPASPLLITASKTLIAGTDFPADIPVTYAILGGGGGGSVDDNDDARGGFSGEIVTGTKTFTYGASVTATIGAGGSSRKQSGDYDPGYSGAASVFDGISAAGGAGGNSSSYAGNSGSRTTVFGTSTDGKRVFSGNYVYGGQTSGYQPGGDGGYTAYDMNIGAVTTVLSTAGGRGSGGGGCFGGGYSGAGGAGLIKLTW